MNIKTRKYHVIERIMQLNEVELDAMESFLEEVKNNPQIKEELMARALQSEKDISEGKVSTLEEANDRLNKQLGL